MKLAVLEGDGPSHSLVNVLKIILIERTSFKISTLWNEDVTSEGHSDQANPSPSHQPDDDNSIKSRSETPSPTTTFASEVVADRLEFLTSDRRVNEELFLMLLDLLVAHLTDKQ